MTAPLDLTTAREEAIRDAAERGVYVQLARDDVPVLLREIDRLRALPVLRTCGECRWCHPSEACTHPKAHAEHEIDGCALPPPSWCPQRGGE